VSPAALASLEDQVALLLLQRQRDLGFHIFTDGEVRRATFMSDFNDAVTGMSSEATLQRTWQGADSTVATPLGVVTGKIRARRRMTAGQTAFLKARAPGAIKMTLPTPNQFPFISYKKEVSDRVYASPSELLWDIVPVIRDEVAALVAEGVAYIQIDAPRYSYYCDPKWRAFIQTEMGMDPDAALNEAIRADNACLEPAQERGATLALHLCRGNNRSQ